MIRWLGAAVICLCSLWCAALNIKDTKRRVRLYSSVVSFVSSLRDGIVCLRLPLDDVYEMCGDELLLSLDFPRLLREKGWRTALTETKMDKMLDRDTVTALISLSEKLGKTPVSEQAEYCDNCICRLREYAERAAAEYPRKSRMVSSLWVIGGLCVMILTV